MLQTAVIAAALWVTVIAACCNVPPEYVVIVGGDESVIVFDLHALVKVTVNSSYTSRIGIAGSPSICLY